MVILVQVIGALIAALGAVGVANPATLMRLVTSAWTAERGIYVVVAIRLIVGLVLIVAAPDSRFPGTLRILGAISVASAITVPVLGPARVRRFVDWWESRSGSFIRAWSLLVIASGAFLVYAGS